MVKKIHFQAIRKPGRRQPPRGQWMFEPFDGALIGVSLLALLWLQWLSHAS